MEHIQYVPGMVVEAPCIIKDMPMDIYHGRPTKKPSVSSSGLRAIENKSALHFHAHWSYNDNCLPQKETQALNYGKFAHDLLFGGDIKELYSVRPTEWDSWRTKDAKAWRDAEIAKGKTVITPDDVILATQMAEALEKHPLIKSGLMQGDVERSLFWEDPATGVCLKARPDCLPSVDGIVVDFKTAADASPHAAMRSIQEHGYSMQGALIGQGMEVLTGVKMTDFVLIFQEKEPPCAILVTAVDNEWIYWARRQLRRSIDTFAKCLETNEWPGYDSEITTSMPDWLRKRFVFEDQHALIPEVQ